MVVHTPWVSSSEPTIPFTCDLSLLSAPSCLAVVVSLSASVVDELLGPCFRSASTSMACTTLLTGSRGGVEFVSVVVLRNCGPLHVISSA